jgi:hypothetical protein
MEKFDKSLLLDQELVNEQTRYLTDALITTINEVQEECRRRNGFASPLALIAALSK